MLETLRAVSKSWVAAILIGLLILSFAIWGINDIFKGGQSTWLARVGGVEIDSRTFESEFTSRVRRQTGPDGKPMTTSEARALGLDRTVLDSMTSDIAVLQEAQRQHITASDAMVLAEIAAIPGVTGVDGKIDQQRLQRGLDSMGMTEAQFVQSVREDLMRRQLLQTAMVGAPAPRGMAVAIQAYENERRIVEYIVLPPEKAGEIAPPDDAALQAYMEANADLYTAPELRGIELLTVGPDDLAPGIEITEDAVKAEYEATKAKYETLEKRELQQITYPSKEEAEAARKELDGGKTFEDLATAKKLTSDDIALGTLNKGDPTVPAGAFEVKEGEVTQPLEGPFGWVLIKVVKVEPGSTKTYDEVRQEVRDGLARDKAIDRLIDMRDQIDDALAATDSLQGAADALKDVVKVNIRKIPAIDAAGNDADGKPIEGLPDGPVFLRDVSVVEQGDKSDLADTPDHVLYVIHTESITPPALRKLADIRDRVTAAWMETEQAKRLKTLADETVTSANAAAVSSADLATQLGLEAKTGTKLTRDGASEELSPQLVADLFKAPKGTWVAGLGVAPRVAVARVTDITSEAPGDLMAQEREIRGDETRTISQGLAEAYRDAIVAAAHVEVDEAQFQEIKKRGSGQ
ncbi:Peptidyl-prolyl cis-trans isomerase D [Alphaproteobacteria bacterium SO-S41]|nr:Peptidyl-prolyl cis-trans isomerase D [Alphaproteobacteria bacterium SO-S41]